MRFKCLDSGHVNKFLWLIMFPSRFLQKGLFRIMSIVQYICCIYWFLLTGIPKPKPLSRVGDSSNRNSVVSTDSLSDDDLVLVDMKVHVLFRMYFTWYTQLIFLTILSHIFYDHVLLNSVLVNKMLDSVLKKVNYFLSRFLFLAFASFQDYVQNGFFVSSCSNISSTVFISIKIQLYIHNTIINIKNLKFE